MSILFTTVPSKRLSRTLLATGTAFFLENVQGWSGADLSASDFGSQLYVVFRDAGNTVMEIMEVDPATVASVNGISILKRGLAFTGDRITEVTARKLDWTKNTTIVELGSVSPQDLQYLIDYIDNIAIAGSPNASTTVKGISKLSAAPTDPDQPIAVGANDPKLPTQAENDALVGSLGTPSSTNPFLTVENEFSADVDQSQTTQDSSTIVGEASTTTRRNRFAQSFIAGRTKIRGFELYKSADSGSFTGTVTLALQADTAGSPSGSNLASVTIPNASWLALAVGAFQAALSAEYSMTAGTTYWLVITTSTSDNTNHPNFGINTAGGYASGSTKFYNAVDGWVDVAMIDLYFKTLNGRNSQVAVTDSSTGLLPATILPYSIVDIVTADAAVINSTTETTVYTKILPAGFFTPNSGLKLSTAFAWATGSANLTMRIKFNGSTAVTISLGTGSTVTKGMSLELWIQNVASMAVQKYLSKLALAINSTGAGVSFNQSDGSVAVDTSGAVVLTVTLQFDSTSNSPSVTFPGIVVEKIG